MAGLGGTVHSSLISGVPLAQHIGAFFVLRWCSRSGTENMTRDGTPPGPADLPPAAIVGGARFAYESRPGGVVSRESVGDVGRQAAALTAGSLVAGYRLEEQIGAGGMAVVFRARDERLGRLVALKVLGPGLAADEAFRQRFIRESRAAAAVDDPHIIPIYEAGEAGGVLFIAMRYVPGGDVGTMIHRVGQLSPRRTAEIISAVASALDAANAAGLVHRDVKPANMLVDARPGRPAHVYLSDFGISKGELSSVGLTGSGQFLGTPGYSAPEQIDGNAVDGRADQYSLACAAFELLSGEPPFPRAHATAVIWAHMSEPPPLLTSRQPGFPLAVDGVFAKALAKAPGDRYASCREFADALRATLGLTPYDSQSGPRMQPDHPSRQAARPADSATVGGRTPINAVPAWVNDGDSARSRMRPRTRQETLTSRPATEHAARHARASQWTPPMALACAEVTGSGAFVGGGPLSSASEEIVPHPGREESSENAETAGGRGRIRSKIFTALLLLVGVAAMVAGAVLGAMQ